jgi:regulation of enolase protein 1 (concanavalin A-like superfamily)
MRWLNEPKVWKKTSDRLSVRADPRTDFWRQTHSGAVRDNGHFYGREVAGDFTASVRISAAYNATYDQSGMMLRQGPEAWMKCGTERIEGRIFLSAVVTEGSSDFSLAEVTSPPASLWLRIHRQGRTIETFASWDGVAFHMFRQFQFAQERPAEIGLMLAAPLGEGFEATFSELALTS